MLHTIQCPSCGLCYHECVLQADAILPTDGGVTIDLEKCNRCGHCVAVCPTGKMVHPYSPAQEKIDRTFTPEEALLFLRTPRSVRRYKSELVPKETLLRLLNAGRYPQTAKNMQGIGYLVVSGREKVDEIHDLYCKIARELPADFPLRDRILRPVLVQEEKSFDALFYDCSQLIFAISDEAHERWKENTQFSFTFLSLMAPSLGLGTCWCGQMALLTAHAQYMRRFGELLKLPEGKRICGCMMVGYPKVKFQRVVERDPLEVLWR